MKKCFDCKYRIVEVCDKHGIVPSQIIRVEINCPDFEPLEEAKYVLIRWLNTMPKDSKHWRYANMILDSMMMRNYDKDLHEAVRWLYELPDSFDVRSIRYGIYFFTPTESDVQAKTTKQDELF